MRISTERVRHQSNYDYYLLPITYYLLPITSSTICGKGMYGDKVHQAVVAAGEKETGITIHYINEHYDEGNIIFQATCPVLPDDSPAEVAKKVHALEYEHFPHIVEEVIGNK